MDRLTPRQKKILICVFLGIGTLLVFWPLTTHEFISYDDAIYITGNAPVRQGLTTESVAWAFTSGEAGNWHPLTWISHMLDVQLFGVQPGWHHLVSALIHAINSVLLFLLLHKLTKAIWRSAFVAALFGLHPLHVQSVAWAAERKDVLSAFFFFLTLLAYAQFVTARQPPEASGTTVDEEPRRSSLVFYFLSLIFFALGLMSKPMLVTVPFVLLLVDYWPLRRWQERFPSEGIRNFVSLVIEKMPFLLLAVVSCAVTLWAQKRGGAVVTVEALSLGSRLANATVAYVDYLRQTIWPADLALLYPFNELPSAGSVIFSAGILIVITIWAVWSFRKHSWLAVGWFWYLGMLVPVIGIVQVGMQQRADRYTYLPLIGIFIMLVWEISERLGSNRATRTALAIGAIATLVACVAITREQLGYWQDSERIFERAVKVTPSNYVALNNYGLAVYKRGDLDGAIQIFEKAVALKPDLDAARCGLGTALMEQRKYDEAALQFNHVLDLEPDNVPARLQMGILLGRLGKLPEAAAAFSKVLERNPNDASAHNNFGNVLLLQGKYEEALVQFAEAVRLQPDYAIAYNNMGTCCNKLGRVSEAIENYHRSLRLQPNSPDVLNKLAWILATQPDAQYRNGAQAVELAVRAGEMTHYQNPMVLATIAAAFAEAGQFQEAISYGELAQKSPATSQQPFAGQLNDMLAAFRAGRAYHTP